MKIDCISDLHGLKPKLEGGDLLIIAGDMTAWDKIKEWAEFFSWLKQQNYRKKILIAGNHDNFFNIGFPKSQKEAEDMAEVKEYLIVTGNMEEEDFTYLCDSGCEFEGLKIWGSPWTQKFVGMNPDCMAFSLNIQSQLMEKWDLIPDDTDILITHCPPYGIGDKTDRKYRVGCNDLRQRIRATNVKLHVFGHIHEGSGVYDVEGRVHINGSQMNANYEEGENNPYTVYFTKNQIRLQSPQVEESLKDLKLEDFDLEEKDVIR
jgi:Icc-related predicted phosphoesterase